MTDFAYYFDRVRERTMRVIACIPPDKIEWTYKPAQQGRKVAYLTVVSFVMLAMVMGLLAMGSTQHTKGSRAGFQHPQKTSGNFLGRLEAYPTEELQ